MLTHDRCTRLVTRDYRNARSDLDCAAAIRASWDEMERLVMPLPVCFALRGAMSFESPVLALGGHTCRAATVVRHVPYL